MVVEEYKPVSEMMLQVKKLTKRFGGLIAVNNLSFELEKNAIVGLIGPNGSGKTTVFGLITGFQQADEGEVYLKGKRISGLRPYEIANRGVGRTFQITRVFAEMTVLENMLVASPQGIGEESRRKTFELLKFVNLLRLKDEYAGNLSYGQKKLLEMVRLLMRDPELLMLDEPMAGVNPVLIDEILQHIRDLQKEGKTFLIVEHNIPVIGEICERVIVLDHGEKIAEDTPSVIQKDDRVVEAYLGGG